MKNFQKISFCNYLKFSNSYHRVSKYGKSAYLTDKKRIHTFATEKRYTNF